MASPGTFCVSAKGPAAYQWLRLPPSRRSSLKQSGPFVATILGVVLEDATGMDLAEKEEVAVIFDRTTSKMVMGRRCGIASPDAFCDKAHLSQTSRGAL